MSRALKPRKLPRQARAVATVDAIVEATTQLLKQGPFARASSARIAQRAGVSVGSVYQYFPSREALLLEVARRHAEALAAHLLSRVAGLGPEVRVDSLVEAVVRGAAEAHAREPQLHRNLVKETARLDVTSPGEASLSLLEEAFASLLAAHPEVKAPDARLAAFLVVRTVDALTHLLVLEQPERLADDKVLAEAARLVSTYLTAPATPRAATGAPGPHPTQAADSTSLTGRRGV